MDIAPMFRRSDPELYQRVDALDTKVDGHDRLLAAYGVSQKHIEDRMEEWIEVSKEQHAENRSRQDTFNTRLLHLTFLVGAGVLIGATSRVPMELITDLFRVVGH